MRLAAGTRIEAEAVLFDMDGTLVDSTSAVERTWRRWAARHGLDSEAILAVSHGRRGAEVAAEFAPVGTDLACEDAWLREAELTEREGIVPVRGAAALLAALPPKRVAIVTSATRELALVRLALAGLPAPDVMVTAEDVTRGKPDPEGYRAAARRLGMEPGQCLVVEDAPAGLRAGRASGARVLAVATTLRPPELDEWDWTPDLAALGVAPAESEAPPKAGASERPLLDTPVRLVVG